MLSRLTRQCAIAALAAGVAAGCIQRPGFVCESESQCESRGIAGVCELTGFCSFSDGSCESGRRYGDEAPTDIAGACVGVEPIQPDNADAAADGPPAPDADPAAPDADPAAPDAMRADAQVPDVPPPDAMPDAAWGIDFVPSNISMAELVAGTDSLVATEPLELNTDMGTIVRASDGVSVRTGGIAFTVVSQTGAPEIGVFSVRDLIVESGGELRVVGTRAVAFAAARDVAIDGLLDVSGGRGDVFAGGPGGFAGGNGSSTTGGGPGGGQTQNDNGDVGGGGAAHVATGGDGGGRGTRVGGAGGLVYGEVNLVPLVGGSGGGSGGDGPGRGQGGGGGGAVQISARGQLVVSAAGRINAGGGGGNGGAIDDGAGGGGAGGAILLEADRVEVAGVLAANGGGGGAGANATVPGAIGSAGPVAAARAAGGVRAGEGGFGGAGGGGDTPEGEAGETVLGQAGSDNAGGGGGGAGRVRIRANDIARAGVVSPAAGLTEQSPL